MEPVCADAARRSAFTRYSRPFRSATINVRALGPARLSLSFFRIGAGTSFIDRKTLVRRPVETKMVEVLKVDVSMRSHVPLSHGLDSRRLTPAFAIASMVDSDLDEAQSGLGETLVLSINQPKLPDHRIRG